MQRGARAGRGEECDTLRTTCPSVKPRGARSTHRTGACYLPAFVPLRGVGWRRMSPRSARFGRWILVLVYVAVIFTLSAQPNLASPFRFRNGDKVAHTLEYGGLGLLLVRAVRGRVGWDRPLAGGMLALALGLGIAVADERFQSIIPGRDCSLFDWMADAGGLILGQLAYLAIRRE